MARVTTFGEIMMRLAAPGHQRFIQTDRFEVTYAGGEANVAVALAQLGHTASYVSALPHGPLGDAAVAALRYYGVDTSGVVRSDDGRLGIYFLETGAAQRASKVIYDRAASTVALTPASVYRWQALLAGQQAFHTTGITPALGENCAAAAAAALATARQLGLLTSFDLNYRAKLWTPQQAQATVGKLLSHVDVVVGNEEDAAKVLGIVPQGVDVTAGQIDHAAYESVCRQIAQKYGSKMVAMTLRESESASVNHWSACLLTGGEFYLSRRYTIQIVDRVGAGDSFCGALLAAILEDQQPADALEFAVAASCLKHTIPGDFNKVTREEILRLSSGDASGRVVR